jgi:hypothetical protein
MEARNPLWFFGHEECVERKKESMYVPLNSLVVLPLKANAILVQLPAATH